MGEQERVIDSTEFQQNIEALAASTQSQMDEKLKDSMDQLQHFIPRYEAEMRRITEEFKGLVGRLAISASVQAEPDENSHMSGSGIIGSFRSKWRKLKEKVKGDEDGDTTSGSPGTYIASLDTNKDQYSDQTRKQHNQVPKNKSSGSKRQTRIKRTDYSGKNTQESRDEKDVSPVLVRFEDWAHKRYGKAHEENNRKRNSLIAAGVLVGSFLFGTFVGSALDDEEEVAVGSVPAWAEEKPELYEEFSETFEPPIVYAILENEPSLYEELTDAGVEPTVISNLLDNTELYNDFVEAGVEEELIYKMFEAPEKLEMLVDDGLTASQIEDVFLAPEAFEELTNASVSTEVAAKILQYPALVEIIEENGLDTPVMSNILTDPQLFYGLTETDLNLETILEILERPEPFSELVEAIVVPVVETQPEPEVVVIEITVPALPPPERPEDVQIPPIVDLGVFVEQGHGFVHEIQDTFHYLNGNQAFEIYHEVIERKFKGDAFTAGPNSVDIESYWHEQTGNYRIGQESHTSWRPEVYSAMVQMIEAEGWAPAAVS